MTSAGIELSHGQVPEFAENRGTPGRPKVRRCVGMIV